MPGIRMSGRIVRHARVFLSGIHALLIIVAVVNYGFPSPASPRTSQVHAGMTTIFKFVTPEVIDISSGVIPGDRASMLLDDPKKERP